MQGENLNFDKILTPFSDQFYMLLKGLSDKESFDDV
jgi:hypothetical protein